MSTTLKDANQRLRTIEPSWENQQLAYGSQLAIARLFVMSYRP
jgi:hypothetical protein